MKLVATGICFLLSCWASASVAESACANVTVRFNQVVVAPDSQNWLEQDLRRAVAKVCAWWGATFTGSLTIDVPEGNGPSMALVPAWRGKRGHIVFPAAMVRRGRAATIHEVVHVFAPNANRFLAEGLAVHAHDRLGGPPAFPNFGKSLHGAARGYAAQADIAALDRLATPAMLKLDGRLGPRETYLVSGSFARFLIERRGLGTFRRLYATTPFVAGQSNAGSPDRWRAIYGASREQLAAEWKGRLATTR